MPPAKSSFVRDCHRYSAEPEAIAASASDEQTEASSEESTAKGGSGIGGKPLTKRRAAKLVAVSASRLKGAKKTPPRRG
jgi:hypothetical protein